MIIGASVRTRTYSAETPSIDQSIERMIVAVFEEEWHNQTLEEIWLQDLPRSSMWHPSDNVMKLLLCKDCVELYRELLHTDRTLHASTRAGRCRRVSSSWLLDLVIVDFTEVSVLVHWACLRGIVRFNDRRNSLGALWFGYGFVFCHSDLFFRDKIVSGIALVLWLRWAGFQFLNLGVWKRFGLVRQRARSDDISKNLIRHNSFLRRPSKNSTGKS